MSECPTHHGVPPSAAGHLDPYGARVILRPAPDALETAPFLIALLEDIAAACVASGASLIGHLKCVLHLSGGAVACNLTSVRAGARGSAGQAGDAPTLLEAAPVIEAGESARLDLAVLVYGLPAEKIDDVVRGTLDRLAEGSGFRYMVEPPGESSPGDDTKVYPLYL